MAKFVLFHLTGGRVNGKRIIREDLLREMYTPQFAIEGQLGGYGLGIAMYPWWRDGTMALNHNGGGYGYATTQTWTPEYQIGVVALTNSSQGGALTGTVANRVFDLMVKAKTASLPPTKPTAERYKFTDKPTIPVDSQLLRRLEGTYKPQGNPVSFKVQDASLFYVTGDKAEKLNAHGETEFTTSIRKFTFYLDESGKPIGVRDLSFWGARDVFLKLID